METIQKWVNMAEKRKHMLIKRPKLFSKIRGLEPTAYFVIKQLSPGSFPRNREASLFHFLIIPN